MLKARLKIWVTLFVFYILIHTFGNNVMDFVTNLFKPSPEYKISIETIDNKININNKVMPTNVGKVTLNYNNQDPDIIITKENELKDGYEKLDDFLYTPFVLLTKDEWENNDNGVNHIYENEIHKYSKDIRYILEAIEKNKTWEEIGINNKNVIGSINSPVTLKIPNKHSKDFQDIKSYIMMVLNDYKPYENNEELEKRADMILSKCIEIESIPSLVDSLNADSKKVDFGMVLCKESTIAECRYCDQGIAVINMVYPVKVSYNLYVKKDDAETINIVKSLVQSKKFYSRTGLRNVESNKGVKNSELDKALQVLDCVELIREDE